MVSGALPSGGLRFDGCGITRRLSLALVLVPLFALVMVPEYVQGVSDPAGKSLLYLVSFGRLRLIDLLLLGLIALHLLAWCVSRRLRVPSPRRLRAPALGMMAAILVALGYGWSMGGTNLFFDWRALALGAGLYVCFALWLRSDGDLQWAAVLFSLIMAGRIAWLLARYAMGGGDVLMGVRIPEFDGPTLSATVFTAVLAMARVDVCPNWRQAALWGALAAASSLLVLLCFRRTYWAELSVAALLLLLLDKRHRVRKALLLLSGVMAVGLWLGPAFYQRIQSLDVTMSDTEFSQDNADHVGDIADAWEQIRQTPVLGIGLGRSYPTSRIQGWKPESVMVHNAPLHVWIKYGVLGLACYLWFHLSMFRELRRRARGLAGGRRVWPAAALVYLSAQFLVSIGFTPWPYSALQSTTLIAFVLAAALAAELPCDIPHCR